METNALLETYLRQLRLPTFLKNYPHFATDAASNNQDFVRFLLALSEQEVNQRETNMLQKRSRHYSRWITQKGENDHKMFSLKTRGAAI